MHGIKLENYVDSVSEFVSECLVLFILFTYVSFWGNIALKEKYLSAEERS